MERLLILLKKTLYYFVFGNFLIAFSAVALTHLSQFGTPINTGDLHLLSFVFFSTLLVYNLNILAGMKGMKNSPLRSVRHEWLLRHENFLKVVSIASLFFVFAEMLSLQRNALLFLFVPGIFALGYALPVPLGKGKIFRLRELPFVKIFLIAWVWGTFTVGLPLVQQSGFTELLHPKNFLLFFSRAVFICAITIPFDIRDLAYDNDKSVMTIPRFLGIEKSKISSLFLLLLFAAVSVLRYFFGFCQDAELIALLLSAFATSVLIKMINPKRKELFYSFCIEAMMIVQWALVIISCLLI